MVFKSNEWFKGTTVYCGEFQIRCNGATLSSLNTIMIYTRTRLDLIYGHPIKPIIEVFGENMVFGENIVFVKNGF